MKLSFTAKTARDMKVVAGELLRKFTPPVVFILSGELGAGKTTLVKAYAEEVGAKARSPSFSIINEYPTKHPVVKKIIHIDLYRLKSANEIELLDPDYEVDESTVIFVEWGEKLPGDIFEGLPRVKCKIEVLENSSRRITCESI